MDFVTALCVLFVIACCGAALGFASNLVLLRGRKTEMSAREIFSHGRLSRAQKEELFDARHIFWSNILRYVGAAMFLVPWVLGITLPITLPFITE